MADDIGFIYLAVNDTMPGLVKIGYTRGSVQSRMKELSAATGVSRPFRAIYFCEVRNPEEVERQLHKQFAYCHEGKEFYRIDWRAVKAAILMMQKKDAARLSEGKSDDDGKRIGKFTLIKWVKAGDADKVRQVLSSGGNPNQTDENNQTALMWAAELGHADIVNVLLDDEADPNKTDKDGRTALMLAAESEHADIAKVLLDYGAHANATSKGGETALDKAGKAEVVKALLNGGANPSDYSLYCAVTAGHAEVVRMLLGGGANPNAAYSAGNEYSVVVFEKAVSAGHADIVKIFLDGGANPSNRNLKSATATGRADIVKMLLDSGAEAG